MATCSLLGQAMGTAAAICIKNDLLPREINNGYVHELQQEILSDGVFLPGVKREIPALTQKATLNLSAEEQEILFNGIERPREDYSENNIILKKGDEICFDFAETETIHELRLQLDPDFSRESISPNRKMRVFTQKLHRGLDFVPVKVAKTIVKEFCVYADGEMIYENKNNYHALVRVPLNCSAKSITVQFKETWGTEDIRIFACDLK